MIILLCPNDLGINKLKDSHDVHGTTIDEVLEAEVRLLETLLWLIFLISFYCLILSVFIRAVPENSRWLPTKGDYLP